jgi:NodT family efflux transporter outer membrane factor (OMF) lipoprotein
MKRIRDRKRSLSGPPQVHPASLALASATSVLYGLLALAGCAVGPNYHRPAAPVSQRFKEAEGWKPAEPRQAASGTDWWSVFDDATLDGLERQIDVSNQTLKASEAAWRQAVALVSQARAGLLPTVAVTAGATRSGGSGGRVGTAATGGIVPAPTTHPSNQFDLTANASWDIDIWGKIRRTIESDVANAQASEAQLAAARLSAQATLASDYIQLRIADEQRQLLDRTVEGYTRALEIAQNQYKVGVVAKADVITAQTQLQGAQSQQIAVGVTRATLEHAIAVLIGKPPADFSLAVATLGTTVPVVPAGVPSSLLERRPDVAEAERRMAAANAQVGVAVSAYFPDLTLNGSYGFVSNVVSHLVSAPNSLWSFGGSATDTLLDFGAGPAAVGPARPADHSPGAGGPGARRLRWRSRHLPSDSPRGVPTGRRRACHAAHPRAAGRAAGTNGQLSEPRAATHAQSVQGGHRRLHRRGDRAGHRARRCADAAHYSSEPPHRERRADPGPRRRLERGLPGHQ